MGIEFISPGVMDNPSHPSSYNLLIVWVCSKLNMPEEGQLSPMLRHGVTVRHSPELQDISAHPGCDLTHSGCGIQAFVMQWLNPGFGRKGDPSAREK